MDKRVHFIAIGGAAMHNLALDLVSSGYHVTGSDDEIYEPAYTRLKYVGILPRQFGWFEDKIDASIELVILGMHAKSDNPELLRAQELGLTILSYPEYIYRRSVNKKRVVIAGSHGKTTTTAMIMHVLKNLDYTFDFLVGAQLEGFDRTVSLTDAPLIIIEGDEYLSSPIDRRPKIHHYHPHISVITGIAWDHINVFPTFENYVDQFRYYLKTFEDDGLLIYNADDDVLADLVTKSVFPPIKRPYSFIKKEFGNQISYNGELYNISVIGQHNLYNMHAALLVCMELGMSASDFFENIKDFKGANKRLQILAQNADRVVFLDFAHAPSKVEATCRSVKEWYESKKLLCVFELHTFSSLNSAFLPQYSDTLKSADKAVLYFNSHTLKMKNMKSLDIDFLQKCFNHPDLLVMTDEAALSEYLQSEQFKEYNILLMTSGNFNKMDLNIFSK